MNSSPVCCDTSFLFSLYSTNEHTIKALRLLRRVHKPLTLSIINDYEIASALRFSEFAGEIGKGKAEVYLDQYHADLLLGRVLIADLDLHRVFAKAKALSENYVLTLGARSFDMLHVAFAVTLGAETFLTFDRNQQKLAIAEGLKSPW
jgi:predicted nucleic acid-binding protein